MAIEIRQLKDKRTNTPFFPTTHWEAISDKPDLTRHYKGLFNASNGNISGGNTTLTSVAEEIGDMYVVGTAGTYATEALKVGDSIIFTSAVAAGTAPTAANFIINKGTTELPSDNVTGSGTSGRIAKWNGTNTITDGPEITSGGTGYLKQDGTWANPIPGDNVTGSGLTSDTIILGNGNSAVKTSSKTITTTAPSSGSADSTIPTSKAVNTAIDNKITNLVSTTSTLTSDEIILGNGNKTVKPSSITITTDTPSESSDNTTIPTSEAVWEAVSNTIPRLLVKFVLMEYYDENEDTTTTVFPEGNIDSDLPCTNQMLKVRMVGGKITDDLYILIGRIKRQNKLKRISYYLNNDYIPCYNTYDEDFLIGNWINITDVENIFRGGIKQLTNFHLYLVEGTDVTSNNIPIHENKKMFFAGGTKGNRYSSRFFVALAKCLINLGSNGSFLQINEIGDIIPITLKFGLSGDVDNPYIQYFGNIGISHENVSYTK